MSKNIYFKSLIIALAVMAFVFIFGAAIFLGSKDDESAVSSQISSTASYINEQSSKVQSQSSKPVSSVAASTQPESPTYINGILIVNKTYPLPRDYGDGLTPQTTAAFEEMKAAAKQDGISLWSVSGYRSYSRQQELYTAYCKRSGQAEADRFSARPGHSEHQTGLAIDLNNASGSFEGTKEAKWIAENCYKYGFIVRYGKDKEQYTGFKYEPWHVRYLGKDLAKKVYDSGLCLEEYLGITSVYAN